MDHLISLGRMSHTSLVLQPAVGLGLLDKPLPFSSLLFDWTPVVGSQKVSGIGYHTINPLQPQPSSPAGPVEMSS